MGPLRALWRSARSKGVTVIDFAVAFVASACFALGELARQRPGRGIL